MSDTANIYRSDLVLRGGSGRLPSQFSSLNGGDESVAQSDGRGDAASQMSGDDRVVDGRRIDADQPDHPDRDGHDVSVRSMARDAVKVDDGRVGAGYRRNLPFDARDVFCAPGGGSWFRRLWFIDHHCIPWVWSDAAGWWAPAIATVAESREGA